MASCEKAMVRIILVEYVHGFKTTNYFTYYTKINLQNQASSVKKSQLLEAIEQGDVICPY